MILAGQLAGEEEVPRFHAEAEAAANLDHPGIVPIYEVGDYAGQHYYSMGYVEGQSLADRVADGPLPPGAAAEQIKAIAEAIGYAHKFGVIHRDLKPGNVLLDATGQPRITDFGLAKQTERDGQLTGAGQILGTPSYMPPEQAAGRLDEIGPLSDVYSIGAILYCLLTGRPPFQAPNIVDTLRQTLEREPVAPRQLDPHIPRDLETICLKCLRKERQRRYPSAEALAEDVGRFLAGEPIRARRVGRAERTIKWMRRRPLMAAMSAAVMLLVVTVVAGSIVAAIRIDAERRGAELARDEARDKEAIALAEKGRAEREEAKALAEMGRAEQEQAKALAEKTRAEREEAKAKAAEERTAAALYSSDIVRARLQYQANNVADAEATLDGCQAERRGWEWHFLKQLCHADLVTLTGHTSWVYAVAYSSDGKLLATAGGGNPFWETPGAGAIQPAEIILWDATTGTRRRTLRGHKNIIKDIAFSPDGKMLASASQDDTVRLWDAVTGSALRILPGRSGPLRQEKGFGANGVAFSPDGKLLAVGLSDKIEVWDLTGPTDTGAPEFNLPVPADYWAAELSFSPDGKSLAVTYRQDHGGRFKVWDLARRTEALTLEANTGHVNGVAMSPDGRYLAAWAHVSGVRIWDAATGKLFLTLSGQSRDSGAGAFSPTGGYFATGYADGVVRVWSVPDGQEIHVFRGHRGAVRGVAFSADGLRLASGSTDGTVKVWDLTQDPEHGVIGAGTLTSPEAIAFVDRGKQLTVVRTGGTVRTIDCDIRAQWIDSPAVTLNGQWLTPAEPACLDAEGRRLAGISRGDRKVAKCWEAATGRELASLRGHKQALWYVTINSGGTHVATAGRSADGGPLHCEIKVWNVKNAQPLFQMDEPNLLVTRLALNPDGDQLGLAGLQLRRGNAGTQPLVESILRVYDVSTAKVVRAFTLRRDTEGRYEPLYAVAFNADGKRLAAAGEARTVLLWDLSAEQPVVTGDGPEMGMDLSFSPTGRRLAIASRKQIKLLDAGSGKEVLTLLGRKHMFPDTHGFNPRVRFSPNGERLAAICHDMSHPLALWSVDQAAGRDPSSRMRAALRRVVATHVRMARIAMQLEQQDGFLFHLTQLDRLELTTAEEYIARGALNARADRIVEAMDDLERAIKLAPDDTDVLFMVGRTYASAGMWDQAAPYFDKYFTQGQGHYETICQVVAVPLYRNHQATYSRYVKQLLESYGESDDPGILFHVLRLGLLMAEDAADPRLVTRMADDCLKDKEERHPQAYYVLLKGMAEYRAGRTEQAVEWLHKADELLPEMVLEIPFFLSMAHHRLNQPERAEAEYQRAIRAMADHWATPASPDRDDAWNDWCRYQILRREADALSP